MKTEQNKPQQNDSEELTEVKADESLDSLLNEQFLPEDGFIQVTKKTEQN